ncbi:LysM peptidoglycan-binding domain-containing protein [Cohnella yongneupensis]|uniref:LysM peptidoglycan-binding domain-containing protein n=1 Tax=Cohnella yongneupensis TaxID=425006 RepID=A0ABW0QYB0_9BACL
MKIHMVKQGDTLYLIAKKYGVPLEDLIKANPEISNPDELAIGMKVKIHSQPKSAFEVMHQHIVQQGDSLWKLSKSWGIHLSDMIKANPQLKNPNALLTGEVVNIPKVGTDQETANGMNMHGGMHGNKKPTGVKPSTETKPETAPMPLPMPMPTPLPAPVAPVVMPPAPVYPVQEIKPIYGGHVAPAEHPFMQYPVPAVQAGAMEPECPPEYAEYGYGNQAISPASTAPGYGGFGQLPGIGSIGGQLGGLGGFYDDKHYGGYGVHDMNPAGFPGVASPAMNAPGMVSPATMNMNAPGMVSPAMMGMQPHYGCKSCGGPTGWASASGVYPGMGYPNAVQPIANAASPYDGYSYSFGPSGPQVGGVQQGGNPYGGYPSYYGSYPDSQVAGVSSAPTQYEHGFANAGAEPYSYGGGLGGFPPTPSFPPMPAMPPLGSLDDRLEDRSGYPEDDDTQVAAPVKQRATAKPKPKQAVARKSKPKRKESLPWINW